MFKLENTRVKRSSGIDPIRHVHQRISESLKTFRVQTDDDKQYKHQDAGRLDKNHIYTCKFVTQENKVLNSNGVIIITTNWLTSIRIQHIRSTEKCFSCHESPLYKDPIFVFVCKHSTKSFISRTCTLGEFSCTFHTQLLKRT